MDVDLFGRRRSDDDPALPIGRLNGLHTHKGGGNADDPTIETRFSADGPYAAIAPGRCGFNPERIRDVGPNENSPGVVFNDGSERSRPSGGSLEQNVLRIEFDRRDGGREKSSVGVNKTVISAQRRRVGQPFDRQLLGIGRSDSKRSFSRS